MHHPPHFPPLPRLSPHHKKRADVEQRFNTPKGFISPKHTAHSLLFPPISPLSLFFLPTLSAFLHTTKNEPTLNNDSTPQRALSPQTHRPLPSFSANILISRHFLICTFPPLTSRFPFHQTTPAPFFSRQYPNFPPFSHLHISAPYFPFPFSSYHVRSLLFPPISPLSLFFLPTLPNLPSLLQFFLLYPFLSPPKNKKNPHQRKKNLIIKKKCCN